MHHCHHHCPSPISTTSPAVITCIAGASVSRNKEKAETSSSSSSSCSLWCSCCGYLRYLLVFLGLLACVLDYMLRFNISVAIVAMVNNSVTQEVNSSYACPAAFNASRDAENTTGAGEYNWSAKEQGIILGAVFWGYVISKTIGGRIAEIFGSTFTVTIAMGLCGILTLLTPSVAAVHPLALAALRFLMGMLQGPIFPAIYSIISRWTLPGERVTMTAVTFSGQCLGALVSLGLSGIVIKSSGWRWVFWGGGILTLAWVPFWVIHVWDYPRLHPGISRRELRLLSSNQNKPRRKVPWSRILKSRHIYLFILLEFVTVWMQGIVLTEGPTFMTNQIGMDLQTVSAVNFVVTGVGWIMCIFYGWLSDLIERREWLSVISNRRLNQGIGMVLIVSSAVGLAVTECDAILVSVYLIMQAIGIPVALVSYVMGPMDIAPNYAGTLSGMVGFGTTSGFLSPLFVSYFVDKKNGWLIIYLVSGCMYGVASIIYMLGVSATEQEWNLYEEIPGTSDDSTTKRQEERK